MIDVRVFSVVKSACLFILKSLRFAVFRSCVLLSCLPTCMYSDVGVRCWMNLPFVQCVLLLTKPVLCVWNKCATAFIGGAVRAAWFRVVGTGWASVFMQSCTCV